MVYLKNRILGPSSDRDRNHNGSHGSNDRSSSSNGDASRDVPHPVQAQTMSWGSLGARPKSVSAARGTAMEGTIFLNLKKNNDW